VSRDVYVELDGDDRKGLVHDVARVVLTNGFNMTRFRASTFPGRGRKTQARVFLSIEASNLDDATKQRLTKQFNEVGVRDVHFQAPIPMDPRISDKLRGALVDGHNGR
jgi:glycine cleavage system regulatory protein